MVNPKSCNHFEKLLRIGVGNPKQKPIRRHVTRARIMIKTGTLGLLLRELYLGRDSLQSDGNSRRNILLKAETNVLGTQKEGTVSTFGR